MDMQIFQVQAARETPSVGSLLIASPLLEDLYFSRSVILMVASEEGRTMGVVMNRAFGSDCRLNSFVPRLKDGPSIPLYCGGPVDRDTVFFLHTLEHLDGAISMGDGLYMNGDFNALLEYIVAGNPVRGVVRFFAGYAGWDNEQLDTEMKNSSWLVGKKEKQHLLDDDCSNLWKWAVQGTGRYGKLWAKYPKYAWLN